MKSWLFVPAFRPDRIGKAFATPADRVIVDLEDAVPPGQKAEARAVVAGLLQQAPAPGMALRLNPLDRPEGIEDIRLLIEAPFRPHTVILPKAESPFQIAQLRALLAAGGRTPPALCPLIESAAGLARAGAILAAEADLAMFGAGDYAADIGADGSWEALAPARARLLEAAALAGIPVIDSPFFSIRDEEALRHETTRARAFGFLGKAAIHPAQVPVIAEVFTPDEASRLWAERVLDENEKGVGVVDGQMIDEAIARRARRVLAVAGEGRAR